MKNFLYLTIAALTIFTAHAANADDFEKRNWLHKEMLDIQEDYDEAIRKIDHSSFTAEQKNILKSQADTNKSLAETQAKAIDVQLQKNKEARQNFISESENKHKAHKIFKEIDDIL